MSLWWHRRGRVRRPQTARLVNASFSVCMSVSPAPGVIRRTANNHLSIEVLPSSVAKRRRRARSACGRVYQLAPAQARSDGRRPRPRRCPRHSRRRERHHRHDRSGLAGWPDDCSQAEPRVRRYFFIEAFCFASI